MKKEITAILLMAFVTMSYGQNLISNWSFETSISPRCDGWFTHCGTELGQDSICMDSAFECQAMLVTDAPPSPIEEWWSLRIHAEFLLENSYVETYITGQSGTKVYRLKYYAKSPAWQSKASIGIGTQSNFSESKSHTDTSSIWKEYIIIDTLTTESSDTITVRLSAGTGDFCLCNSYYDWIVLEEIDSTTATDNIMKEVHPIYFFPNPAKEQISIRLPESLKGDCYLKLYNSSGHLMGRYFLPSGMREKEIKLHEGFCAGVYYGELVRVVDGVPVARGRFVK